MEGSTLRLNGMKVEVRPAEGKEAQRLQLEKALKVLKRKLEKDGVLIEYRERRYYKKPSEINREHNKKIKKNRR